MPRYFIELTYKGTRYSGFQSQPNALTIQAAIETALQTRYKQPFELTCSSRTDAGVHALQNFFHVDTEITIEPQHIYNLNALVPSDIVIKQITRVPDTAHARFGATHRCYKYYITNQRNPFLTETAWFYPYTLDIEALHLAAKMVLVHIDFTAFSKRNTQVKTFICHIMNSQWYYEKDCLVYEVKANRFLRGMVRGLVGTMLQVGRGIITINQFKEIIEGKDCTKANFNTPAHGLFLAEVAYPEGLL
ncbi:tRNA pseudouridine(38-40) synthase TruA [Parasediminibacterium sp. JCM 36343]|uniref:tRNA pseudouridine(38-40) synthase TruA n=1 Tax=Parasediminibacterium sp. JCM 36343 TaxID=3374279 RepID=UPI00397C78C6